MLDAASVALAGDLVRHIAMLARLELTAEEEQMFAQQLEEILRFVEKLRELDTEGVEPTAHVVEMAALFRPDEVTNGPRAGELLANAPAREGNLFKVPKIIE